ncbi:MAG: hypothetical protein NTW86_00820 [Candidatus Sumerlaeota bacterium]|nr:hypothetical protein [Candidatus Sumerlaeota bacterium]
MAQILVRGLDDTVVDKLKKLAKKRGRSLQAEARMILEREAKNQMQLADRQAIMKRLEQFRRRLKGRPMADSVKLIREDRDR